MFGKFLLIGLLCIASAIVTLQEEPKSSDWIAYKTKHGKFYASQVEESMRHAIFLRNKQKIDLFNAEKSELAGFRMGLNHLSDKTEVELQKSMRFKPAEKFLIRNTNEGEQFLAQILGNKSEPLPETVDWRQVPGRVTEVKEEGGPCSSSWAFSTTGLLEGQELLVTGRKDLVSLSAQMLIDCADIDACWGEWPAQALITVLNSDGINSEEAYPFEGIHGDCRYNKTNSIMRARGPVILPQDEGVLKAVVAKYGPVSVVVNGRPFRHYREGVLKDTSCTNDIYSLNQAVLAVGYGTDPKEGDYWLLKNSWGSTWGEDGYVRLARNKDNMCAIVTLATIAAVYK